MKNEELTKKLLSPSKNSRLEKFGRYLTFACLSLIVVIVAMILIFVAQKGLSTFFVNGVNVFDSNSLCDWCSCLYDRGVSKRSKDTATGD